VVGNTNGMYSVLVPENLVAAFEAMIDDIRNVLPGTDVPADKIPLIKETFKKNNANINRHLTY
jgi:hypothetical protein